jgi:hypothetical protein
MKKIAFVIALAVLMVGQTYPQWKKVAKPSVAQAEMPASPASRDLGTQVAADTIYQTSFAASFGYVSSAETFQGGRFYGGLINVYQVIDEYSYLNLWSTLPGTNAEDQSFGLSYNRQLLIPVQNLVVDWSAGLMTMLPRDQASKQWIGVPIGLKASYQIFGPFSLYALLDAVPAFDVNRNNPSGSDKVGITFLGAGGITVAP